MGALWIRALGPLQLNADGVQVPVSSRNLRIVLECLALRANSVVAADFLAEAIWDGHPPAHPGPQLQVYVANLRNLLEPNRHKEVASHRLASRPGGYLLAVADDELDLLQFRAHLAAGDRPWTCSSALLFRILPTLSCWSLTSKRWRKPGW